MTSSIIQYYQLKYGFRAVLEERQLARLRPVFSVSSLPVNTSSSLGPQHSAARWEAVATQNREDGWGVWRPNLDFQQNIWSFRYNRFLDIGECLRQCR